MATDDFFRARLDTVIDPRHPLVVLAVRLPWPAIEAALSPKLAPQDLPAKSEALDGLSGVESGEFGAGVSRAG